eukprot:3364656-Amphidinium_carterae.1
MLQSGCRGGGWVAGYMAVVATLEHAQQPISVVTWLVPPSRSILMLGFGSNGQVMRLRMLWPGSSCKAGRTRCMQHILLAPGTMHGRVAL